MLKNNGNAPVITPSDVKIGAGETLEEVTQDDLKSSGIQALIFDGILSEVNKGKKNEKVAEESKRG